MQILRLFILAIGVTAWGAVPEPKEHFGYTPGDDYKLADYQDVISYFQKLEKSSDRIKLVPFGKSAMGKTMYVAFISSAANLAKLDRYRDISRKLALGEVNAEEARKLSEEGKAIVWIDSGLHASEVAPVQQASHLAHRMLTDETPEFQRFRDKAILMQIPVINPDGLDWVAHWYRSNVGTPFELAPLPQLYHKYAGHDNNRDWYMLNLEETRAVSRLLFQEWFPQIVYNQHQSPAFPARIFIPPYAEPLNPNIPAPVMEGINVIGSAMKERFARENKPGILSYFGFDAWWNGGLRSVPAFHNMHGILTETAGNSYATPRTYRSTDLPERFGNGIPTKEPSIFYQRPWMGGRWGLRDAIDYMLTADFAILDLASSRSTQFLYKAWELARFNMELGRKGKPYAYVVPVDQADRYSTIEMLRRLQLAGVVVERAKSEFAVNGKSYPAGTFIMPAAQPFRGYLVDLMEPQKYPEIRAGQTGPTKRPYDVAGWTLRMLMGVQVDRVEEAFQAPTDRDPDMRHSEAPTDHRDSGSFLTTMNALKQGKQVRWGADGKVLVEGQASTEEFGRGAYEMRTPRVGLYEPFTANMDTGWTQWVLDNFQIAHTMVRNDDIRNGNLRQRFDTIILASQSAASILHGTRAGERVGGRRSSGASTEEVMQRPEYTGGITLAGLAALDEFVRGGGTLIAFDAATDLPVQFFPLPVTGRLRARSENEAPEEGSSSGFYSPGSLLRATVDGSSPLALGVPQEIAIFTTGGQAWDINLLPNFNKGDKEVKTVVRYATSNLLASGWVSGERQVTGRPVLLDARHGQGHVVLFGFRPQFRGQSFATFKFLLNAIYIGSAKARVM